jgi:hypothetical protein
LVVIKETIVFEMIYLSSFYKLNPPGFFKERVRISLNPQSSVCSIRYKFSISTSYSKSYWKKGHYGMDFYPIVNKSKTLAK